MPSRNTYSISPLNKAVPSYALNVEDRQGRDRIVLAVQLSRILLRVLEVEAFKALQKSVNEVTKGSKSEANTAILANQLGRILSSLRWRISWWAVFGNGSNNPDAARIRFTERVTRLTQVLYFYYFLTKKRVSSSRDQLLVRVCSIYPDFPPVYEDLPQCETFEGFQAWMRQGEDMIHAVQMQQNMSRY